MSLFEWEAVKILTAQYSRILFTEYEYGPKF